MIEKYFYGEHKKPQLTAYERRKINSHKIAQVQFEPQHPKSEPKNLYKDYMDKRHEEFTAKDIKGKEKPKKPVWTPLDQIKEDELWDE